ncbi:MAG: hypothetical protein AAF541_14810 [Pseudomonadota bacterium]
MRCEEANALLVEYASDELSPELKLEVEASISGCDKCQADLEAIVSMQRMATTWHEETPPAWSPQPVTSGKPVLGDFLDNFRLWFPTFASATALVLVAVLFVQQGNFSDTGTLPANSTAATDYQNLPQLPQGEAQQAALVQSVLESSEEQRAQEIQALLKVLKAEMDKRSIATEESLRYIISHQIQGQQELDELYRQVEELMAAEPVIEGQPSSGGIQ